MTTDPNPPATMLWPTDRPARRLEYEAITDPAVREVWRRSYERLPATSSDAAVVVLLDLIADVHDHGRECRVPRWLAA